MVAMRDFENFSLEFCSNNSLRVFIKFSHSQGRYIASSFGRALSLFPTSNGFSCALEIRT